MKSSSIMQMQVPDQAQSLSRIKESVELSRDGDFPTAGVAGFISLVWISWTGFFLVRKFLDFIDAPFYMEWLPIVLLIISMLVTAFTGLVIGCFEHESIVRIGHYFKNISEKITGSAGHDIRLDYGVEQPAHWKPGRWIRVRQKARGGIYRTLFSPKRIFRRTLLGEVLWYDADKDVYMQKRSYLGFAHLTEETEMFAGRRYAFRKALESI